MAEMVAGEKKGDNSDSDSDDGANGAGDVSEVPGGRQNVKHSTCIFTVKLMFAPLSNYHTMKVYVYLGMRCDVSGQFCALVRLLYQKKKSPVSIS